MDGKAEIMLRGSDNMIIGHPDGTTTEIGDMTADYRHYMVYSPNLTYTNTGNEYLLYLNGETGKPYAIGPGGQKWMDYPCPRGEAGDWGDGTGHRATKHYFGAPYLDGRKPSMFIGRGCYTRHKFCALDVNPSTHELSQRWYLEYLEPGPWMGNGFHNFAIADVDMDGRDEIMFGSMTIDDNGMGLSTSGFGHGDAQHCGDLDPYRWGLEQFTCLEHNPANNYRSATTSEVYYRLKGTGDDGRCMAGNFLPDYPGSEGQSIACSAISLVADKQIPNVWVGALNFRLYWDGDLCDELLNSPGIGRNPEVQDGGGGRILLLPGAMNNGSKNNPCMTADIFGDWREEVFSRDFNDLIISATSIPTDYRITTLLHDHQYRGGMLWQCIGYNQPPHCSFFLGELEGITTCPPALTNEGRTEIPSGSTITTAYNGKQTLVCEQKNSTITVADGAEPWVAFFNVPSWVQGTSESNTIVKETPIVYTYYKCNVKGAGFSGATHLVKQGEGELILPAVEQKHTGGTDVWNGILSFDGTMRQSRLWLNRHTTLKSDGGDFLSIQADYNSTIYPGGQEHVGQMSTDTLLMGFGSRVVFDIQADGTCDQLNTKSLTIETKDWEYGPKYLAPVVEFRMAEVKEGRYELGTLDKVSGQLSDLIIEGLGTHYKSELLQQDGKLILDITPMRAGGDIVWAGAESNVWDMARTNNFSLDGEATYFATDDNVLFNGTDSQTEVYLKGDLEPESVIVDSDRDYLFKGNGRLVGQTRLEKRGNGKLTIKTDNTFTGGARISGGTVSVEVLSNENMNRGGLGLLADTPSSLVIENGATLEMTLNGTLDTPIRVESAEGGVLKNNETFIMNKTISGTRFIKDGGGVLTLFNDNPELDTLVIRNGVLKNDWVSWPAKAVIMEGGSIDDGPGTSYPIIVPKGKKGRWNPANRFVFSNKILGEGELTVFSVVEFGNNYVVTRTPIAIDMTEFRGTIVADADWGDGRFTFATKKGIPNGTIRILDHVVLLNADGNTMRIGRLEGKGRLGGWCAFSNGASYQTPTWQIGNDDDWTWGGRIVDLTNIEKVGQGKVTLTGEQNDFSGDITVKEGELHINKKIRLGTGKLTVDEGATLSGVSDSLSNSQYTINGRLQVGVIAKAYNGEMKFGNKNLTFGENSELEMGIYTKATEIKTGGALLSDILIMRMNGTVKLNYHPSLDLAVGDSVVLWKAKICMGTPRLADPVIDASKGLYWDDSNLKKGILYVTNQVPSAISSPLSEADDDAPAEVFSLSGARVASGGSLRQLRSQLPAGAYIVRQNRKSYKIIISK